MSNDVAFLYHGSPVDIKGDTLKAHRGRNPEGGEEANRFGIYATPDYYTAVIYSMNASRTTLTRPKRLFIEYSYDTIRVSFEHCRWTREDGYVYKIPASSFHMNNDFEYCSSEDVTIVEKEQISFSTIVNLINSGKIVLIEDNLPNSRVMRMLLRIEDSFVAFVAKVSHLLSLAYNTVVRCK